MIETDNDISPGKKYIFCVCLCYYLPWQQVMKQRVAAELEQEQTLPLSPASAGRQQTRFHQLNQSEQVKCENTYWIKNQWGGLVIKNLPASERDTGSIPGLGGSHLPLSHSYWAWAVRPEAAPTEPTRRTTEAARPGAQVSIRRSLGGRSSCPLASTRAGPPAAVRPPRSQE